MLLLNQCLNLVIDVCPKYYETENSLILKQENDFTSLNITFIQLKISPQKYVKDSNDFIVAIQGWCDFKSWLFFFFKIENNGNYKSSSNCHLKLCPRSMDYFPIFKFFNF